MYHKSEDMKRKNDFHKAARKKRLAIMLYGSSHNIADGYYVKGKIHCSCPICSEKTNPKKFGYGVTFHRLGRNFSVSDQRKIEKMTYAQQEYLEKMTYAQ